MNFTFGKFAYKNFSNRYNNFKSFYEKFPSNNFNNKKVFNIFNSQANCGIKLLINFSNKFYTNSFLSQSVNLLENSGSIVGPKLLTGEVKTFLELKKDESEQTAVCIADRFSSANVLALISHGM